MSDRKNEPNSSSLEEAITRILTDMSKLEVDSEGYSKAADNLVKLVKAQNESIKVDNERDLEEKKLRIETEKLRSWRPSPDALVGAAASILGIVAILNHERFGVITSRAMMFVGKLR